jgi:hypothetical protein
MVFAVKLPAINQVQLYRMHFASHLESFWAVTDIQASTTDAVERSEKSCAGSRGITSSLGACAKLRIGTISFVMCVRASVRTHGTTRLPLDGF